MTHATVRPASRSWLLGVTLLVIGLSAVVGVAAARASAETRNATNRWGQLAESQRVSRAGTLPDSALLADARQAPALGIAPDAQARMIAEIERIARAGSLNSISVARAARPSAAFVPARQLRGLAVEAAAYAVAVGFTGRFVDARKFVNSLPPSVSVTQMEAARTADATRYKLLLSVYELHGKSIP